MSTAERWYFTLDGETVVLRSRFESEDGTTIGDAFDEIRPGQSVLNLTYRDLFDARAGVVVIENERARIASGATEN